MNLLESLFLKFLSKTDPELLVSFCEENGRLKQVENQIISDPFLAYEYSIKVVKGRWEEAEKYIVKDDYCSINYAKNILKDRFFLYEKELKLNKDKEKIIRYCVEIKKRFPEIEPVIAKGSIDVILTYAREVIKGRFELAESKIIKKSRFILLYTDVVKEKIPEMHNAMTLFSFKNPNDKFVKEYFKKYGP